MTLMSLKGVMGMDARANARRVFVALLGLGLAAGCDSNATTNEPGGSDELTFAGFALTSDDESDDGFSDSANTDPLVAAIGDEATTDDASELPPADEVDPEALPPEDRDHLFRTVLVVWGQARVNPELAGTPTAWKGRIAIDSGALKVARVLRFERGVREGAAADGAAAGATQQDHLVRDEDPRAVSFETTTTTHHDGLLLVLALPRDASAVTGSFVFETEHFTKSIPLASLIRGDTQTFIADDLGNSLLVASHLPHRCPHGMLRLQWERKNTRGGVVGGRIYGPRGELAGTLVGIWGEVDGKRRLKGSYLAVDGAFRGTVLGTWAPFPAASGEDGGTFRGVWKVRGAVKGMLGGVYRVGEAAGVGAGAGFWRAACNDFRGACRPDEGTSTPPVASCVCEPDGENDFDGACACDVPQPSSCVGAEPAPAE